MLRVEYTRLNSLFADYTRNISRGGTFIKTTKALPVGTRFIFALCLPELPFAVPRTKTKLAHAPDEPRTLPLVGVVLLLLMNENGPNGRRNVLNISLITTIVTFLLSLLIWTGFDNANPGFQMV